MRIPYAYPAPETGAETGAETEIGYRDRTNDAKMPYPYPCSCPLA